MIIVNTIERDWLSQCLKPAMASTTDVDVVNSAIKESAPRGWLAVMACEEPLPIISADNMRSFDSSNQLVNGWLSRVREGIYSIPSVEDIFVSIEDNDVDVWVVIPERDLGILDQIVEKEGELFDMLVSGESPPFLVDFHIIYRRGRKIEELAPTKAIRLSR